MNSNNILTSKNKEEIGQLIEKFRSTVKTHGGDVKLVNITGNKVYLKLLGACAGCSLAHTSYDIILGGIIREKFPEVEIKFSNPLQNLRRIKLPIVKDK